MSPDEIAPHLALSYDTDTIKHLFNVAAGLDSAVLGEHEILGQVRDAWEEARREGTLTTALDLLFRRAVEVGKQVRSDTSIGRGTTSLGQAAVSSPVATSAGWPAAGHRARRRRHRHHRRRCPGGPGRGRPGGGQPGGPAGRGRWPRPSAPEPSGSKASSRELLDADVLVTASVAPGVVVELELVSGSWPSGAVAPSCRNLFFAECCRHRILDSMNFVAHVEYVQARFARACAARNFERDIDRQQKAALLRLRCRYPKAKSGSLLRPRRAQPAACAENARAEGQSN